MKGKVFWSLVVGAMFWFAALGGCRKEIVNDVPALAKGVRNPVVVQLAGSVVTYDGLTVLDVFAAACLAGETAHPDLGTDHAAVARYCYDRAAAMLAERERRLR